MKKKLLSIAISIILISAIAITPVSAARVDLYKDQTSATSANVSGTQRQFYGTNFSNSLHKVFFISQYSSGTGWIEDMQVLVPPDTNLDRISTKNRPLGLWRLELNVEGFGYTNCIAFGIIND